MKIKTKSYILAAALIAAGSMSAQAALVAEWTFDSETLENTGTTGSVHDGTFVGGTATNGTHLSRFSVVISVMDFCKYVSWLG
ncbi:MAG: hypothetical protein ACSHX6_15860, partial [Akkermansiaceae bacterium]